MLICGLDDNLITVYEGKRMPSGGITMKAEHHLVRNVQALEGGDSTYNVHVRLCVSYLCRPHLRAKPRLRVLSLHTPLMQLLVPSLYTCVSLL